MGAHKRLGEFLVEAGIIDSRQLTRALEYSLNKGIPTGRVLILLHYLKELELEAALRLQTLVKLDTLEFAKAIEVLKLVNIKQLNIEAALGQLNIDPSKINTAKDYSETLLLLEKLTLIEATKPDSRQDIVELHISIAETFFNEDKLEKTLEHLGKAKQLSEEPTEVHDFKQGALSGNTSRMRQSSKEEQELILARILTIKGNVHFVEDKYDQAEDDYKKALLIKQRYLGDDNSETAHLLESIAEIYDARGEYEQAEHYYLEALSIRQKASDAESNGQEHCLKNIVNKLLFLQKAKALPTTKKMLGDLCLSLKLVDSDNLKALILESKRSQIPLGRLMIAKNLLTDEMLKTILAAQAMIAEGLIPESLVLKATRLSFEKNINLNQSLQKLGLVDDDKYNSPQMQELLLTMEDLLKMEKLLGPEHEDIARLCLRLADLYLGREKYNEALLFLQRANRIIEKQISTPNALLCSAVYKQAVVLCLLDRISDSQALWWRHLELVQTVFGQEHLEVALSLLHLSLFCRITESLAQAEQYLQWSNHMIIKLLAHISYFSESTDPIRLLEAFARHFLILGQLDRSEYEYKLCLLYSKNIDGKDHFNQAIILENYAKLLKANKDMDAYEEISKQARKIKELAWSD